MLVITFMGILALLDSTARKPGFILRNDDYWALQNMKTCHTVERGGKILYCPDCATKVVIYNPCNHRGCPDCYKKNQVGWMIKAQKKLLPTSHYHLVFSIPQRFTTVWLKEKKAVMESLFASAHKAVKAIEEKYEITFAYMLAFQSHGKGLCYKPHIHCALSAGGIDSQKNWVTQGTIAYTLLEKVFRETFYKEIASRVAVEDLFELSDIAVNEWTVFPTVHKDSGKAIIEYLSHSVSGVVLDMEQNFEYQEDGNDISFKEIHLGDMIKTTLSKKVFTERYLNHIPPSRAVTVRYYGLYSNQYAGVINEIRKTMHINPENKVDKGDNEDIYKCPECNKVMKLLFEILPDKKTDFKLFGFTQGPPLHGTIIKAA